MKIWLNYIPTCGDELLKKKSLTFHIIKGTPSIKLGLLFLEELDFQILNKTVEKYLPDPKTKCIVLSTQIMRHLSSIMLK